MHCQVVLQVAENITHNKSFEKYKVTPASRVPPFDGIAIVM